MGASRIVAALGPLLAGCAALPADQLGSVAPRHRLPVDGGGTLETAAAAAVPRLATAAADGGAAKR